MTSVQSYPGCIANGSLHIETPDFSGRGALFTAAGGGSGRALRRVTPVGNLQRVSLHVFGLTGGIGSGKTTVGRRFRARGLPVIDADDLAREVVAPGTPGLAEIVDTFGTDVLDDAGALDRKALARRVFSDESARRRLNAITHPRVAALSAERANLLERQGEPLACYEVPLLFEGRLAEALRPVVVVHAPLEAQLSRTVSRDGATADEARARVHAQMPLEEKIRLADYAIDNSGALEATHARADEVLDAICVGLGIDPSRYPRVG